MPQKCLHKGCGKTFDTPDESECVYHPGPPVFHEGQKGWKCCKPRVLTFDEFMTIPPCTKGNHSAVDDTPAPEPKKLDAETSNGAQKVEDPKPNPVLPVDQQRLPQKPQAAPRPSASPAPPEDESDDPDTAIPAKATCKRRGCNATYNGDSGDRSEEKCVHHPGHPIFHEGSKGWTCCKKRVLDFDDFLKMAGCKTKTRHCFVGKKKEDVGEEKLDSVRHDFYQTPSTVIASLYLKKVDKDTSKIIFASPTTISLDLRTADRKRFEQDLPLYAAIDTEKSSYKIMGTKVEFNLVKADASAGWPVLRADDRLTGEIIQTGRAGRA